jgi:predicted nucleic acid-binding protein
MGELVLPASGSVYLDANGFIYSVERIEPYCTILDRLWQATKDQQVMVITSELTLLEVMVKPLKTQNTALIAAFNAILRDSPDVQMVSITQSVLEEAAMLRATLNLKTPDALHAATAIQQKCSLFVTNDKGFKQITGLPVTVLSEKIP